MRGARGRGIINAIRLMLSLFELKLKIGRLKRTSKLCDTGMQDVSTKKAHRSSTITTRPMRLSVGWVERSDTQRVRR